MSNMETNIEQQTPTLDQNGQVVPPTPKSKKILVIGIIGLLLLTVGIVYYFGLRNTILKKSNPQTISENSNSVNKILPSSQNIFVPQFKNTLVYLKYNVNNLDSTTIAEYDLNTNKEINFTQNSQVQPDDQENPSTVLSPDKKMLAVISKDNNGELIIYDLNNQASKVIASNMWVSGSTYYNDNYIDSQVVWSSDSKQLAFNSGTTGYPEIYIINADGSNQKMLTTDQGFSKVNIAWSPDNKKILYRTEKIVVFPSGGTGSSGNTAELKFFDLTTNTESNITPADDQSREVLGLNNPPVQTIAWRNNQELISFYAYPVGNTNPLKGIWVYSLSTNKATQLFPYNLDSNSNYIPVNGSVELDNYDANTSTVNISIVNLDNGEVQNFTIPNVKSLVGKVVLSPDKSLVNYQDSTGFWFYFLTTKQSIKVMDLTGRSYTSVGGNIWTPDSKKLIFGANVVLGEGSGNVQISQQENDNQGIYMVNSDGTGLVKLPINKDLGILAWL